MMFASRLEVTPLAEDPASSCHQGVPSMQGVYRKMKELERELQCSICLELLCEPKCLSCQHHFCDGCLERAQEHAKANTCPLCKAPFFRREIRATPAVGNIVSIYRELRTELCAVAAQRDEVFGSQQVTTTVTPMSQHHQGKGAAKVAEGAGESSLWREWSRQVEAQKAAGGEEEEEEEASRASPSERRPRRRRSVTQRRRRSQSDASLMSNGNPQRNRRRRARGRDGVDHVEVIRTTRQTRARRGGRKRERLLQPQADDSSSSDEEQQSDSVHAEESPTQPKRARSAVLTSSQMSTCLHPVLLATGINPETIDNVRLAVIGIGGRWVDEWDPSVTHVLVSMNRANLAPRTTKYMLALLGGAWAVGFDWIESCLLASDWVSEVPFAVSGDQAYHGSCRRGMGPPQPLVQYHDAGTHRRLFSGMKVELRGRFRLPEPQVELMCHLLQAGGAHLSLGADAVVPARASPGRLSRRSRSLRLDPVTARVPNATDPPLAETTVIFAASSCGVACQLAAPGIPVVKPSWVLDSISCLMALPYSDYLYTAVPHASVSASSPSSDNVSQPCEEEEEEGGEEGGEEDDISADAYGVGDESEEEDHDMPVASEESHDEAHEGAQSDDSSDQVDDDPRSQQPHMHCEDVECGGQRESDDCEGGESGAQGTIEGDADDHMEDVARGGSCEEEEEEEEEDEEEAAEEEDAGEVEEEEEEEEEEELAHEGNVEMDPLEEVHGVQTLPTVGGGEVPERTEPTDGLAVVQGIPTVIKGAAEPMEASKVVIPRTGGTFDTMMGATPASSTAPSFSSEECNDGAGQAEEASSRGIEASRNPACSPAATSPAAPGPVLEGAPTAAASAAAMILDDDSSSSQEWDEGQGDVVVEAGAGARPLLDATAQPPITEATSGSHHQPSEEDEEEKVVEEDGDEVGEDEEDFMCPTQVDRGDVSGRGYRPVGFGFQDRDDNVENIMFAAQGGTSTSWLANSPALRMMPCDMDELVPSTPVDAASQVDDWRF